MTATGRWAAPSTSRITPPTPVLAPPNGSTADGWLCVSALRAIVVPSTNDTMPALPTNADRTNGRVDGVGRGAQLIEQRRELDPVRCATPARNVLCAQCSLHVWAIVSSSTSVGSRPSASKWSRTATSSAGIEGQGALVAEPGEAAGVEAAHGDRLHAAGGVVAGVEVGIGEGAASSAR